MDYYSGIDANGNLTTTSERWHKDDQKNELAIQNATNALNYALAREQNQWNIDFWNMQNEYNSPGNQLKLLKEAGLNPLFYSGNVGASSGASSLQSADLSVAQNSYQSQEQAKMANLINAIQGIGSGAEMLLKQKEVDLASSRLEQDIQESKSRIFSNYAAGESAQAATKSTLNGLKLQDMNYYNLAFTIGETEARTRSINEQTRITKADADFFESIVDQRKLKYDKDLEVVEKQIQGYILDNLTKKKQLSILNITEEMQKILKENAEFEKAGAREKGKLVQKGYDFLNNLLVLIEDELRSRGIWHSTLPSFGGSSRNPDLDQIKRNKSASLYYDDPDSRGIWQLP